MNNDLRMNNHLFVNKLPWLIMNQDCLSGMNLLQDQSIDMVLTDLPFATTKHEWDKEINLDELWRQWNRVVKPSAAIVLFAVQPFTTKLINSNQKGYKHSWIWNKHESGNFAVAKYMPLTITEEILIFSLTGDKIAYYPQMTQGKMRTKGGKNSVKNGEGFGGLKNVSYQSDMYYPKNLLDFPSVPRTHRKHPSEKPVDLLRYLIRTYSKENDTILDCTAGCGNTGIAAIQEKRIFIGYEIDTTFYNIATDELIKCSKF